MNKKTKRVLLWGVGLPLGIIVVLVVVITSVVRHSLPHGYQAGEHHAVASLKTFATAQEDFRINDRDGNRVEDYWRGDIAGLWAMRVGDKKIMLIEASMAAADDRPLPAHAAEVDRAARKGFWFRALRFADEGKPDPQRFAAVAFPESPEAGKRMYIISHDNVVYVKPIGGKAEAPEVYPTPEELSSWKRLD